MIEESNEINLLNADSEASLPNLDWRMIVSFSPRLQILQGTILKDGRISEKETFTVIYLWASPRKVLLA